jgi:hypothetical protein
MPETSDAMFCKEVQGFESDSAAKRHSEGRDGTQYRIEFARLRAELPIDFPSNPS